MFSLELSFGTQMVEIVVALGKVSGSEVSDNMQSASAQSTSDDDYTFFFSVGNIGSSSK